MMSIVWEMQDPNWVAKHVALTLFCGLLQRTNLASFVQGRTVEELAKESHSDPAKLRMVLAFISSASNLLESSPPDHFRLHPQYLKSPAELFQVCKYMGAYWPILAAPWGALSEALEHRPDINHAALAQAYAVLAERPLKWLPEFLLQFPFTSLLEIGCGAAPVSREMARLRPRLRAWAVDASPPMIDLARHLVGRESLSEQVHVSLGTVEDLCDGRLAGMFDADLVCLRSVLNSMFERGCREVESCLRRIGACFPTAHICVSEYYGRLNAAHLDNDEIPTLVHDVIQLMSFQGIPPHDPDEWDKIYKNAGLQLVHRRVDKSVRGITQFADLLKTAR